MWFLCCHIPYSQSQRQSAASRLTLGLQPGCSAPLPSLLHLCENHTHGLSPAPHRKPNHKTQSRGWGHTGPCRPALGSPMGQLTSQMLNKSSSPAPSVPHLELSWKFQMLSSAKKCVRTFQRFCGSGKRCGGGSAHGTGPKNFGEIQMSQCPQCFG